MEVRDSQGEPSSLHRGGWGGGRGGDLLQEAVQGGTLAGKEGALVRDRLDRLLQEGDKLAHLVAALGGEETLKPLPLESALGYLLHKGERVAKQLALELVTMGTHNEDWGPLWTPGADAVDEGPPVEEVMRDIFVGFGHVQSDDKGGRVVRGDGLEVGVLQGVAALVPREVVDQCVAPAPRNQRHGVTDDPDRWVLCRAAAAGASKLHL